MSRYQGLSWAHQQLVCRGFFGGLPRCKKADLMMADDAMAGRYGPWSLRRGGRGPTQCVGLTGAVPAALTMAILNKSVKIAERELKHEGLLFRIKRDSVPRSLQRIR
jgi:hypothetical protein